jgi:hypothetical protein
MERLGGWYSLHYVYVNPLGISNSGLFCTTKKRTCTTDNPMARRTTCLRTMTKGLACVGIHSGATAIHRHTRNGTGTRRYYTIAGGAVESVLSLVVPARILLEQMESRPDPLPSDKEHQGTESWWTTCGLCGKHPISHMEGGIVSVTESHPPPVRRVCEECLAARRTLRKLSLPIP